MPKGALLHSHSGGIANTDWLLIKLLNIKLLHFHQSRPAKIYLRAINDFRKRRSPYWFY
jgi:hypothetical protein